MTEARVIDVCCGSRMMWFDKADPRAIFGDRRSETLTVTDRSHREDGTRTLHIEPDVLMDFRALPYPDGSFRLVAFDPPHLERAGPRSWLAAKYGKLSDDWRADLRRGFAECFRVLEPEGVLVFKWNETQVKLREVLALTPEKPLFGQVSGRGGLTHWLVFMKPRPTGHKETTLWPNDIRNLGADMLRHLQAENEAMRETLEFVERWAVHHASKPHMTAELALGSIQHHPEIRAITERYADGKRPDTFDPYARIAELEAQLVAEARATAEHKLRADQLAQQHRMQAQMHAQATQQLAELEARKPLPPARVDELMAEAGYLGASAESRADFINGLRHGEGAHGITGGPS